MVKNSPEHVEALRLAVEMKADPHWARNEFRRQLDALAIKAALAAEERAQTQALRLRSEHQRREVRLRRDGYLN